MARIYRRSDKDGMYYADLPNIHGARRRVPAGKVARAAEEVARRLEQAVEFARAKLPPSAELSQWLESQPPRHLSRYVRLGLLSPDAASMHRPVRSVLPVWIAEMESRKRDPRHIRQTQAHVEGVLADAEITHWNEASQAKIRAALDRYASESDLSARTRNARLVAIRSFALWCRGNGYAASDPTAGIAKLDEKADRRRVRRDLPPEHLRRLLAAARASGEAVRGMAGPDRAMLYLVAASTGWRWSELRRLRRMDFLLDESPPMLAPPGTAQKSGREDAVPLRKDVSGALRAYFAERPAPPDAPALPMPGSDCGARLLAHDLAETGRDGEAIPYIDARGRVADFHSLRHALATMMSRSKAPIKVAQKVMRHSDPTLTLGVYTHAETEEQAEALENLPPLL